MKYEYEYYKLNEEGSQYEDLDLTSNEPVEARYIPAKAMMDRGNPYIEALPFPWDGERVSQEYERRILEYDHGKIKKMDPMNKLLQVQLLKELRFPLPFHKDLEIDFYNALLTSYRARKPLSSNGRPVTYTAENTKQEETEILVGDAGAPTNSGFALLGYSGCGKSSAIEMLLSHYPQVIEHKGDGWKFTQITYLVVVCHANSNFRALYSEIGDAIDKALGNTMPFYKNIVDHTAGLGSKQSLIQEWIERFAIGIIIFDEIQLIDFTHTKENTFDSLLVMANITKVGMAVVGTQEAKQKMFPNLQTARRIGPIITGSRYCGSRRFFNALVKKILHYQWFDEMIEYTDEIADTLYDLTKGIVSQLIDLYICINTDWIEKSKKPKIDGEYIRQVSKKFYPGLQDVLEHIDAEDADDLLLEAKNYAEAKIQEIFDAEKQAQEEARLEVESKETAERQVSIENVASIIRVMYDEYTDSMITTAFNKVMRKKDAEGRSDNEIARMVVDILQKQPKRRNKKSDVEPPDLEHMRSFLEEES